MVRRFLGKTVDIEVVYVPVGCGYTDPGENIVTVMKKVTKASVGVFSMGSCDMQFFTEAGIPAVIFGPGDPARCHQLNEYCKVKNIGKCVNICKNVIEAFVET
jgi:acetylornithine deacetylase/succinyl-diaminopimelate desuccinylase-like protein